MSIIPDPLPLRWAPSALSPATLADMAMHAEGVPGHRGMLYRLGIAYHRAAGEQHVAQVLGDAEAIATATLARLDVAGAIDDALEVIADDALSGLSNATDRRRADMLELLAPLVNAIVAPLYADVRQLADAVAVLEGGGA